MSAAKKQKVSNEATGSGININFALDKEFEVETLTLVSNSPVSCLQGLAPRADDLLANFKIRTVHDLANWKYGVWATAIVDLAAVEEDGKRAAGSKMNVSRAVDKDQREKSLKELCKADVAGLSGISDDGASLLKALKVSTIGALGAWKYIKWARAICTLAEREIGAGGASRELQQLLK